MPLPFSVTTTRYDGSCFLPTLCNLIINIERILANKAPEVNGTPLYQTSDVLYNHDWCIIDLCKNQLDKLVINSLEEKAKIKDIDKISADMHQSRKRTPMRNLRPSLGLELK